VTAVYDRHSYDREKQEALDAWAAKLFEIVTASVIVESTARQDTNAGMFQVSS
jgi:hypothetical protein